MDTQKKYTLLICNPGHFHAALSLRSSHSLLSSDVYVYSEDSPELKNFENFISDFNSREENPTNWKLHVYRGPDYLEKLIADKNGDVAILAGKNNVKISHISRIAKAGIHVLADKPWLTDLANLKHLEEASSHTDILVRDIMTERFEITTILQKLFLKEKTIFGEMAPDSNEYPSIYKESVHHLYKMVNGKPLRRPNWYFDTNIQGEGIVDVTTHLADMVQWMLSSGEPIEFGKNLELQDARRWYTCLSQTKFKSITNEDFPDFLQAYIRDNQLLYFCNGELKYRLNNIPVHIKVIWNLEPPVGGGDTHFSLIRGSLSNLIIEQTGESSFKPEFYIEPKQNFSRVFDEVNGALKNQDQRYSGLKAQKSGDRIHIKIPDVLRTTHEEHFAEVRDAYLNNLSEGKMDSIESNHILSKYKLLAKARELAFNSDFEPLPTYNFQNMEAI